MPPIQLINDINDFGNLWSINPFQKDVRITRRRMVRKLLIKYGDDAGLLDVLIQVNGYLNSELADEDIKASRIAINLIGYGAYLFNSMNPNVKKSMEEPLFWQNEIERYKNLDKNHITDRNPLILSEYNIAGILSANARFHNTMEKNIAGASSRINDLKNDIWKACFGNNLCVSKDTNEILRKLNVLILGETGTGKDLVAQIIMSSTILDKTFAVNHIKNQTVNIAAINPNLIESELFGHVKGAFTDAKKEKNGLLKMANNGCLFVDEIAELPVELQVKLLRVIESGKVRKVGVDMNEENIDVRFIGATSRDIIKMIKTGYFRTDLFYRLNGCVIKMPSLRELDKIDAVKIAASFLPKKYQNSFEFNPDIGRSIEDLFGKHTWPGNMRELRTSIYNMLVMGEMPANLDEEGSTINTNLSGQIQEHIPSGVQSGTETLKNTKRWYINHVLNMSEGNLSATARILKVDINTVKRNK